METIRSKQIAGTFEVGFVLVGSTSSVAKANTLTSDICSLSSRRPTYSVGELYPSVVVRSETQVTVYRIASGAIGVDSIPNGDFISDDDLWRKIDALFGIWADRDEINDDWLNSLRGYSSSKMTELYGDEWE